MRIEVDTDKCTGLGLCESISPDVFEVQDDGTLSILEHEVAEDQRSQMLNAVRACPTAALRIDG